MKISKILLFILSILLTNVIGKAQEIRGADMDFAKTSSLVYQINLDLYFCSDQEVDRPFITLSFGDGFQDTAWLNTQQNIGLDIWKLSYDVEHEYPGAGNFSIWLLDSIPMPEIVNYDYEEGDTFLFYGDLLIHTTPVGQNGSPYFTNDQTDISFNEGIWQHRMELENPDGVNLLSDFTDLPDFVYQDFTLPIATNSFSLDETNLEVIWDRPYQSGKYILPMFVLDYLSSGPNNIIPITKAHRFMIIEVNEEDIVTFIKPKQSSKGDFLLHPNPAREKTTLRFKARQSGQIQVALFDLNGKTVSSFETTITEGLNNKNIDLESIPSGIYFFKILHDRRIISTQKLVVF